MLETHLADGKGDRVDAVVGVALDAVEAAGVSGSIHSYIRV